MKIAEAILDYKDPESREITFCGQRVAVTGPTITATPELLKAVRGLAGTPEELEKMTVIDLALPLMPCVPEIAISCIRDPDTMEPIFQEDTQEIREKLKRVPAGEGLKLLAACIELFKG